jgi:hypothetical protein
MRTSKYFATDSSKMENKPFVGFASTDIKDGHNRKFRIYSVHIHGGITSNWRNTRKHRKNILGENLTIFSDWARVLKVTVTPTMSNT